MKRHFQCAEQVKSPSNLTKYCACHTKWKSSVICVTYETSFPMRGASKVTLQPHQILRLPRNSEFKISARNPWIASANIKDDSTIIEDNPTMKSSSRTRRFGDLPRANFATVLYSWTVTTFRAPVTLLNCYSTELWLLLNCVTLHLNWIYCACHEKYTTELLLYWTVLYWTVTLLNCDSTELLLYWTVTLLNCYSTELWLYWTVTLLNCDSTELLLYWTVTLLNCDSTELWLYWTVTLLNCYSTELWLYWTVTLLNCDSTELLLYWTVTLLNCYSTELLLYWTVTLLNCYSTELLLYWTVTLLNCDSTELWLYWTVTLLNCYSTELWLYWTVTLLNCYSTELLLYWTVKHFKTS